jgi:hypothetical protein
MAIDDRARLTGSAGFSGSVVTGLAAGERWEGATVVEAGAGAPFGCWGVD